MLKLKPLMTGKKTLKEEILQLMQFILNKNGKIFDPQQGVNDLNNKIVKFIGDPQTRIEEDFLRIIRFLRFTIQYNSPVENSHYSSNKIKIKWY